MRKLFHNLLGVLAHATIRRFAPTVIAVTGTVGKTSAKDAIAAVVERKGSVRKTAGNLNNEIGLPLAIFGKAKSAGPNPFFWCGVFFGALWKLVRGGAFPDFLVLEMAADHPGDIRYLTWIAPPRISVITAITPVHMQFYRSLAELAEEKFAALKALDGSGTAVLNGDDPTVRAFSDRTAARTLTFGYGQEHTVHVRDVRVEYGPPLPSGARRAVLGTTLTFTRKGEGDVSVLLQGVLGAGFVMNALAAAAVGIAVDIPLRDAAEALSSIRFPRGRLRLLDGVDDLLLVDDSYNSSPAAVTLALEAVAGCDPSLERPVRRIAVLGTMAELGLSAERAHEEMGRAVAQEKFHGLVAFGQYAEATVRGAEAEGMAQEGIFHAKTHEEAIAHVKTVAQPGDIVLIKGSQNAARMEIVTAGLLRDPELAAELLVRQGKEWKKRGKPLFTIEHR